jgi:chaperonin cofactor prefoldin
MTEQDLTDRLQALDDQRKQMEANLNAIAGAMQECNFWLKKLSTPKPEQQNGDAN